MYEKIKMEKKYDQIRIVKELENYYKEIEYEKLKELSDNIFQSLEELVNQNEDFQLTNNSYTNKERLFSLSMVAKGALDYDMYDTKGKIGKLKLGFSANSYFGVAYTKLKIQLYVKYGDQKNKYDPKIVNDITAKFKSFEKEG